MKKYLSLLAIILLIVFAYTNCTIITDRWVIDWDDNDSGGGTQNTLTIDNNTGEEIDRILYHIGDRPPTSWDSANSLSDTVLNGFSRTFTLGNTNDKDIEVADGETVWIRVSAENQWYSSKLFAVDGFTYESGFNDCWVAYVYKEY